MSHFIPKDKMPSISAPVLKTTTGTPYLTTPGCALIAATATDLRGVQDFLDGFDESLGFDQYLQDPDELDDGAQLVKFAGQLCYLSLNEDRTKNCDAKRYLDNIKSSGHGSVLEHANYSILFWGIGRDCTHEAVRHRAGFGFSQVSQRYVDGPCLRFVERQEFAQDPDLHSRFLDRVDRDKAEYDWIAGRLVDLYTQGGKLQLTRTQRRDLRKRVNQAARSCLPNETEAPILITSNGRGWRHFSEMRGSIHADITIRRAAYGAFKCLKAWEPLLFSDYTEKELEDGSVGLDTTWRKV